jgi:hypothetical protein
MKMEQTECSETLAFKPQTPGNYQEEIKQYSEQGESLKPRKCNIGHSPSPRQNPPRTLKTGAANLVLGLVMDLRRVMM